MSKKDKTNINFSKDNLNDDIFLALFRKGANEYLENDLLCKQPDEAKESKDILSEITDKKIRNMIKHAIRKEKGNSAKKILPKILVLVSAVFIVFFVTVFSVEALRAPFLNFFVYTKEEITDIELNNQHGMMEGENFEEMFGYIPEGFELESEEIRRQNVRLSFLSAKQESIVINIYYEGSGVRIDTESSDYKEIIIKEGQGFYSTKNELTSLIIIKREHSYLINATIELSEIVKIAENIK